MSPTVTLPLGTSAFTLVVNDGDLDSDPDAVDIAVAVQVEGLLAPLAGLVREGFPVAFPDIAFARRRVLPMRLRMFCGGQVLTDADVAAPAIVAIKRIGDPPLDLEVIDLEVGVASDSGIHFRFLNNS